MRRPTTGEVSESAFGSRVTGLTAAKMNDCRVARAGPGRADRVPGMDRRESPAAHHVYSSARRQTDARCGGSSGPLRMQQFSRPRALTVDLHWPPTSLSPRIVLRSRGTPTSCSSIRRFPPHDSFKSALRSRTPRAVSQTRDRRSRAHGVPRRSRWRRRLRCYRTHTRSVPQS
jgi:hypothetical protein